MQARRDFLYIEGQAPMVRKVHVMLYCNWHEKYIGVALQGEQTSLAEIYTAELS